MLIDSLTEENWEERDAKQAELEKKFEAVDAIEDRGIPTAEKEQKIMFACRDPTIWAYKTLRDKQNKPLKPYFFQDKIMNDRHRFIHVSAANQIGKTWGAGVIKGLHHSVYTNNASVMLISATEKQATAILDEMKWMLKRGKIDYDPIIDEVDNRTEFHLQSPDRIGTSVVRVFPPTKKILGFPSTLTIKDETGFWEKIDELDPIEYFQQCVEPRSNTTKDWEHPFLTMGQIVSITNPNGQQGLAWWLRNNKNWHQYVYSWLAKPDNTIEEYEQKKKELPPIRFASIYAARYLLASGGFITQQQFERFKSYDVKLSIPPGSVLFLGGDLSSEEPKFKHTDWSTLYGVIQIKNIAFPEYPRIRLVYAEEFAPGTPREEYYNEIRRLRDLPGVTIAKYGYDKVGVGDSVKRDLIGRGILFENQIEVLSYSLPNKSEVYLNFQSLFRQDLIEGSEVPKLEEQTLALKVDQPTGSPHVKVHHKTEGVKDDHPDALANACFMAREPFVVPKIEFVPHEVKSADSIDWSQKTVICPKCEKEGKDGYHRAPAQKNFQKILCLAHED